MLPAERRSGILTIADGVRIIQLPMSVIKQRRLLFGGLAVGALILLAVAFLPLAGERDAAQGGLIGSTAPSLAVDGAPPPTLNGETIDLEELRGQVVWVNFWTTSCIPCRTEMPAMQEMADRYADRGLTIVGVDVGEGTDSVREFVDELRVTYPIVMDFDSTIFSRYSPLFGVPRHYFVGRDGKVVAARIGELRPEEMAPLVDELLGS